MTSLRLAIQSIYEQIDYEAAGDSGVMVRCDIDASLAAELYRGLAENPDRLANIVVRTVSWAVLSPACTLDDVAALRSLASSLTRWCAEGRTPNAPLPTTRPGSLRSLAVNAERALFTYDAEAFAAMLADFRATHLRGCRERALAKRWQSWMDHIVMAPHGTTLGAAAQLEELCQSDLVTQGLGGDTTYAPVLPTAPEGFGEVWQDGPNNALQRCVLEAHEVTDEGRELRAQIRVDPSRMSSLAVEYLFEQVLLWRAFPERYRDRIRTIHYEANDRSWSHVVG